MEFCIYSVSIITGVDLSKIFGGQTKILWANQNMGVQKVVKSDKCMGVSQLLGAGALAAPQSLRLYMVAALFILFET